MKKKIDQTRRLADKIANAQHISEEKFAFQMQYDQQKEEEKRDNAIHVQQERKRNKAALDRSRKDQLTSMLHESLVAKQDKFRALDLASQQREAIEQEKLE